MALWRVEAISLATSIENKASFLVFADQALVAVLSHLGDGHGEEIGGRWYVEYLAPDPMQSPLFETYEAALAYIQKSRNGPTAKP